MGIHIKALKDHRQLIDERDIDISLCVFQDLGSLSRLYASRSKDSVRDCTIYGCHQLSYGGFLSRNNFRNASQTVLTVSGVDSLRGITDKELNSGYQIAILSQYWPDDVLSYTWINSGLDNDNRALGKVVSN